MFFQWLVCVLGEYLNTGNKLLLFQVELVPVQKSLGSNQLLPPVTVSVPYLLAKEVFHIFSVYTLLCVSVFLVLLSSLGKEGRPGAARCRGKI